MTTAAKTTAPTPAPMMALPTVKLIFDALTAEAGLMPRASQLTLALDTRRIVATGGIGCVEAPTGTGKTLGYLAGALDAYAHAGDQIPIVVATATVGLQEQIIRYDVPRLVQIGALDPNRVAIAKGRGRYFCPRTAAALEDKKMRDGQFDMFQSDKHVADGGVPIALEMLAAWRKKEWNGDQDSWEGVLPACWGSTCAASSDTCVNRACDQFNECPYMASRAKLATAQLIIANHDLVLADLAQRADEQSTTALPPKKYALIFDEAHNLPDKAVNTKRADARLSDIDWLRKLAEYGESVRSSAKVSKVLERSPQFAADVFTGGAALLLSELERWSKIVDAECTFTLSGTHSWGLASPDAALLGGALLMAHQADAIVEALKAATKAYTDLAEEVVGIEKGVAVRMLAQSHRFHRLAKDLQSGLALFCSGDRLVRWASRSRDGHIALHTQPIEGCEVLNKLLWPIKFPVMLVSATLQIAGSFERFRAKSGLPAHAYTAALPPVFDYSRGFFHQPKMEFAPGEDGYELELVTKIQLLFRKNTAPGMLVLFTSRETMRRVVNALDADVREKVLTPDNMGVPELVALHKQKIDQGYRSILIGLDSMSEGLDLPGKYCGHVVITRLPFAVPGDPVEEARRELMGKAWFREAYLADMLITLIQATGRLIRREDDHGVITILDRRLSTKGYALDAVNALPNFRRGVRLADYFQMALERGFDLTHGQKKAGAMPTLVWTQADIAARPAATSPAAPVGKPSLAVVKPNPATDW